MTERLTTLAAVKDYLDITDGNSDSFLTRLIDAASQFILTWISRDSFGVQQYTYNFLGNGKDHVMLPVWPIRNVSSVGIAGSGVPASVLGNYGNPGSGYVVSDLLAYPSAPQTLQLYGYNFWQGAPSQVIYTAGFQGSETLTIPNASPWQLTPIQFGQWTSDVSVTINGVAAVAVASNPAAGQYSVDAWGTYTFAQTDQGKAAVITYNFCPAEVSYAATELIGEWYRRRDRLGLVSKTLGSQETVTFSQKEMGDSIRAMLQPYANVVPF